MIRAHDDINQVPSTSLKFILSVSKIDGETVSQQLNPGFFSTNGRTTTISSVITVHYFQLTTRLTFFELSNNNFNNTITINFSFISSS